MLRTLCEKTSEVIIIIHHGWTLKDDITELLNEVNEGMLPEFDEDTATQIKQLFDNWKSKNVHFHVRIVLTKSKGYSQ